MSAAIGPGDWVECIRMTSPAVISAGVRAGCIYCVEAIKDMAPRRCVSCGSGCPSIALRLQGIRFAPLGYSANWICAGAFRPIYRPSQSLIRDLQQPIPADLEHA